MTEDDKKAKVGDCTFIILAKLPSGDIHLVNIPNKEVIGWLRRKDKFQVMENKIGGINFTAIL